MPRTLLYIGQDRDVLAYLMDVPGESVRVDTIDAARRYLLRDERAVGEDHLIAYGADIAARYGTGSTASALHRDEPLRAWGSPIVLIHGPHGRALATASIRLGSRDPRHGRPARIVSLPNDWAWLLRVLAGTERAAR